jgi:hypothetical protein
MPTKRRRITRLPDGELDEGQRAWLLGEDHLAPLKAGLWPYNRWCWLWRQLEAKRPEAALPDGSPGPRDLWRTFGTDALEAWHKKHGDTPHPLAALLGVPECRSD